MRRLALAVRIVWVVVAFLAGMAIWLLLRRGGSAAAVAAGAEAFQAAPVVTQAMKDRFQQILRDQETEATKAQIAAVMNPKDTETFKVVFPRQVSIAALAYTLGDAPAARTLLLSNYDQVEQQIMPAMNPSPGDIAAFDADKLKFTCDQLIALNTELKAKLAAMKTGLTDLGGTITTGIAMKDENMKFQNTYKATCEGNLSDACKSLASQDSLLYPLMAQYDTVTLTQAQQEGKISDAIQTVNDVIKLMKCPSITGISYNADTDFPFIDTEALRLKLEELSPYYLSPASLKYISGKLFDGDQVKFVDSSRELGYTLQDTMREVAEANGYTINTAGKLV